MKPKTIKELFVLLPVVLIFSCASHHVASTPPLQTPQETLKLSLPVQYSFCDSKNVQFATVTLMLPSPLLTARAHGKWIGQLAPSYRRPNSKFVTASDKLNVPAWHDLICSKDAEHPSNAIVNLNPDTPDDVIELSIPISDEIVTGYWFYTTDAGGVDQGKCVGAFQAPMVYIGGEFHNPGPYFWTNGMTAADLIRQAGGFTVFAWGRLRVLRYDGSEERYRLKFARELTNGIDFTIPYIPLKPGDQVINPRQ